MSAKQPRTDVRGAVVVVADTSPAGRQAAAWAAQQAELENRRLVLVRTTGSLGTTGTTWLDSADRATSPALRAMQDDGEAVLDDVGAQLRHVHRDLVIDHLVVAADAVPELHRLSADAHLLVLGSDGHGLVPHGTPWQVGPRVVRAAGCPTVVVPRHAHTVRRGVLVGVDLTERSGEVLRFAFEMASLRAVPLVAAHVARVTREDRVAEVERGLSEAVSGFREEFPDVPVRCEVLHGWATGRLIQESARMHLLVIGRHHRLGAYESPLGHVRSGMVARAGCPVAVVPVATDSVAHA
jgi:nucleotide-binding universal stress UspA family protein